MSGTSESPPSSRPRDTPVLVVDFGTTTSAATVVAGEEAWPVPEPVTGAATWPSAVFWDGQQMLVGALAERRKRSEPESFAAEFKRGLAADSSVVLGRRRFRPVEQVVALLAAVRAEAERLHGAAISRVLITVPAGYGPSDPRRARMIAAAEAAGLDTVELLPEPVAAAFAPMAGPPFAPGDLVLVYDLGGGSFDAALVRIGERWHEVLGHATLDDCGGRDLDALLAGRIHADGQEWLAPLLSSAAASPSDPATLRLGMAVTDFARRLKHQLSAAPAVEDFFLPNAPAYRLTQADLRALAAPLLGRTVACCTDLLARVGVPPHQVAAILTVGGGSRMPAVGELLQQALRLPLHKVEDPDLAVVRGAARWLPHSGPRRVPAATSPEPSIPLSFAIPGGSARLLRWLVAPGQAYVAGVPLARVRLPGGALWDLTARVPGTLDRLLAAPGSEVTAHEWLALARP
ncbi:Hsp70 family protein [Phytohabitans sp. ZYX-F-186]|uniref:Hsp70 family protein n=1 Tax=Phytohabitans maris TaxID=3071409 RepID=A0ABU0ZLL4_9ACTN|nr:Hsp70 family protein [Phytohabitans sp. ZYX-F-186]MDQ7907145.1 Hsp70 family protein [Phytohabitans sp. ZYX-F-186]